MSKTTQKNHGQSPSADIGKQDYRKALQKLQIELVKLQKHFILCNDKTQPQSRRPPFILPVSHVSEPNQRRWASASAC